MIDKDTFRWARAGLVFIACITMSSILFGFNLFGLAGAFLCSVISAGKAR